MSTASAHLSRGILPLLAAPALATSAIALQAPDDAEKASCADCFAPPVRILAGEDHLGQDRLYPSPQFHDVNGDGRLDIVIGDLFGNVTFAPRLAGDAVAFGPEQPMLRADGEELKFNNW